MIAKITYTEVTVRKHPKENKYVIEGKHIRHDNMGKWEGGGNLGDVYPVSGKLVLMHYGNGKPLAIFNDVQDMVDNIELIYGVKPQILFKQAA